MASHAGATWASHGVAEGRGIIVPGISLENSGMKTVFKVAAAFAAGALVMFYLDPATGRRRRALVRDRAAATGHDAGRFARAKSKRAADRVRGLVARTRGRWSHQAIDDDRLEARVRSQLGRLVDRPHGVEVRVRDGCVTLGGFAAVHEIADLTDRVASMHGIASVQCHVRPNTTLPSDAVQHRH